MFESKKYFQDSDLYFLTSSSSRRLWQSSDGKAMLVYYQHSEIHTRMSFQIFILADLKDDNVDVVIERCY